MSEKRKAPESYDLFDPPAECQAENIKSLQEYEAMYQKSISNPDAFWGELATKNFHWHKPFEQVREYNFDMSKATIDIKWFIGGETNICYNAIDRHIEAGHGDQVAILWEGNDDEDAKITYTELHDRVAKLSNWLKSEGVQKGDRVSIYLPVVPELIVSVLAVARIGAVHSVVFAGFSSESFCDRIMDSQSSVVITADGTMRGPKYIDLKALTDKALAHCTEKGFAVKRVCLLKRSGKECGFVAGRDVWWHESVDSQSVDCPVVWVGSEDPLFMLYTSGSTGKPKAVLHTTGGYMVYTATTFKYVFDYRPGDVFFCTADVGWITGHSYMAYGPLVSRATVVAFEGVPTHPHPGRFWEVCAKYKVNEFYTAPTAIRSLMRLGEEHVTKFDMSSLRVLGTVGEPINPEVWRWYHRVVGGGRCSVVDTWFQTETGGIMITPLPGIAQKPGSAMRPFFGVEPVVLDADGKILEGATSGYLAIRAAWPSCMRTVYGDHSRFEQTYFSMFKGYYLTGDGCKRDEDGCYWLTGRIDDVMNVSGHRIGTAEIESALCLHATVAEAAVVGAPHEIKGEGIYCFVTLKVGVESSDKLMAELKTQVRNEIGAFATPDFIHWAPALPKTRSGKIMRRILRKVVHNEEDQIGDTSTLADPAVVDALIAHHAVLTKRK